MRIEQLEYLTAVTRHGSLRRASEQLHVSQPALSEAIRSLERELGVTLLDRRRTGARISEQGLELLPRMATVLEAVGDLRSAAGTQCRESRSIRVGTVSAGTSALLVPGIRRFTAAHDGTRVDVLSILPADIQRGLGEGSIDLGLVNVLPGDDVPAGLHATTLLQGRPVVVLRHDDPLTVHDEIDVEQLRSSTFVAMREGYVMHRFALRLFGGALPPDVIATDGAEHGKFIVGSGGGVTILPDYSVIGDPLEEAGVLTTRPIAGVRTAVSMLSWRRAGARVPTVVRLFEESLQALASEHPKGRWARG